MLQSRTTQGEPDCNLSTPNTDDVIDILDSEEEKESGVLETIITTSIPLTKHYRIQISCCACEKKKALTCGAFTQTQCITALHLFWHSTSLTPYRSPVQDQDQDQDQDQTKFW
jgi:hypothetical protein